MGVRRGVAALRLPDSRARVWHYPIAKLFEDTLEHGATGMAEQQASTQRGLGRNAQRRIDLPAPRPVGRQGETDSEEHAADQVASATEKKTRHEKQECTPCFFWYYATCSKGKSCAYCHIKHPKSEYKALRRARPDRQRTSHQLSPEATLMSSSGSRTRGQPGVCHEDERAADPLARATEKRMRHDKKKCTPCFFWYYSSCSQGESCAYCHIKHPKSDYKALRRARPERERGRRQLSPEAVPWNGSSRSNEFGLIAL